jgi:hypothetical protein
MNIFNSDYCHSVKNKNNINLQCHNKHKPNEIFCGIHLNSTNIILYKNEENNNIDLNDNISKQKKDIDNKNIENLDLDIEINNKIYESVIVNSPIKNDDKIIYNKNELFEIISNNLYISVYSIRKSIKNCGLKSMIDTKQSKQILIKLLKNLLSKERYYISNIQLIIQIQSFLRRWLVHRKKICCNDTDILTFTCKYEIPNKYFYIFNDKINNKKYAYDIRTLYQIIESEYPSCPYTFRTFTKEEKDIIIEYKNKLNKRGIDIDIPKVVLTIEEETEMKIKDVFYQINMLDNYTNPSWFKKLELYQLMELYVRTEDIWNYRSSMDLESKKRIVNNGSVFNIPVPIIKTLKSKLKLQNIILNDYIRLITEGINREEKKLGAILILTGLVEVSIDASDALPHLIQI